MHPLRFPSGRTAAEVDSHGCVCPSSDRSPTISSLDQIRMIDRKQEVGASPELLGDWKDVISSVAARAQQCWLTCIPSEARRPPSAAALQLTTPVLLAPFEAHVPHSGAKRDVQRLYPKRLSMPLCCLPSSPVSGAA